MNKNFFGKKLVECSKDPLTGFKRNGCCESVVGDYGKHIVCAQVDQRFLDYSFKNGNDLITPNKENIFPGLKEGDRWCLCVTRWIEAEKAGKAPKIILEATHEKTLEYTSLHLLVKYAYKD